MFVTYAYKYFNVMNKKIVILIVLQFVFIGCFAGEKVEGAVISLLSSENKEVWAMNHTNANGEFYFCQIPVGNYILSIDIPFSSFSSDQKDKEKLDNLIDMSCDERHGRMVFKLDYNCFVFDINCEDQSKREFKPDFQIFKLENKYHITIATAELTEPFDLRGILQSLTVHYYARCLESGKFKLPEQLK